MTATNPETKPEKTVLVLGGTGKTGRRIAERLRARGIPIRIGSRSGEQPFDWEDHSTWAAALEGMRAVYLSYYPDLALPEAATAIEAFSKLAVGSGVKRLVLLSGRGEEGAQRSEQALQASGADWTILRASWFNQNFSEGFLLEPLLSGEVALPVGAIPEPFVDVNDVADVATAALTDDKHIGQLYELTGPRALTFAEACGEISSVKGQPIRYRNISVETFVSALETQRTPQVWIDLMTELFTEVLDGRNAYVTDGVRRALGREPTDFSVYARDAAATGVWQTQP